MLSLRPMAISCLLSLGLTITLLDGGVACAAEPRSPELQAVIDKAKTEHELKLVWGEDTMGGSAGVKRYQDDINKLYGTHLEFKFAPLDSLAREGENLVIEQKAGQAASADVYFATPAQYVPLLGQKPFLNVDWVKLLPNRISNDMVEADGVVVRVVTGLPGVSYNTALVKDAPASLTDFLDPKWKGKLASTPYAASFDVLTANDMWGPQRTIDYVTKLQPQLAGLIGCAEEQRIASGEYAALVMDCEGSASTRYQRLGAPVGHIIPKDAAVMRYFYLSIPRNAQNADAAKLFVVYLLTEAGQKAVWDLYGMDLDTFAGSHSGEVVQAETKKGITFKAATVTWWLQHPEIGPTTGKLVKILAGAGR